MRKLGKAVFFIVLALIGALVTLSFMGAYSWYGDRKDVIIKGAGDIRWGIDIRGGVDVTFTPPEGYDASDTDMAAAESIIKVRLVSQNITDYEVYTDYNKDRIIVRFPWKEGESDFNPEQAIKELGETAMLTFREGLELDSAGRFTGVTEQNVILEGRDIVQASVAFDQQNQNAPLVALELSPEGARKFAEATERLVNQRISIWMDETVISAPYVSQKITDGNAVITGSADAQEAKDLADKINGGALPFKLNTENYNTISATLGLGAKDTMVRAGGIAFAVVCIFMISLYRLPGVIACIGLAGQVGLMVASITGFFPVFPSFTLTLPGIAGIILSIGFGVDANVITAERIKEEIVSGKTIDGAVSAGFKRAFTAIFDGNVTVIIVAVILLGAFGPPSSIFAKMLSWAFFMFGPATAGNIYSFGYTLLVGVFCNFIMGIWACRLMLTSISKFKAFRKAWFFGGEKA